MTAARAPAIVPANGAVGAKSSSARPGQSGLVDVAAHEPAAIRGHLRSRPILGGARPQPAARRAWPGRCGRCSPSTRPSASTPGRRGCCGHPGERISFPHALAAAASTVTASPPDRLDLALAAFLLKILMSAFFVRDRPGRASPRKSKKASDFPARKPAINPRRPWRASGKRPDPSSCPGTPALGGRAPERRIKTLACRWATLW